MSKRQTNRPNCNSKADNDSENMIGSSNLFQFSLWSDTLHVHMEKKRIAMKIIVPVSLVILRCMFMYF